MNIEIKDENLSIIFSNEGFSKTKLVNLCLMRDTGDGEKILEFEVDFPIDELKSAVDAFYSLREMNT